MMFFCQLMEDWMFSVLYYTPHLFTIISTPSLQVELEPVGLGLGFMCLI